MALIDQINIENSAGPGEKKIIFCQQNGLKYSTLCLMNLEKMTFTIFGKNPRRGTSLSWELTQKQEKKKEIRGKKSETPRLLQPTVLMWETYP